MLTKLSFRFGPTFESEPLSFSPGPMTLLVGPSNVGKSRALFEISIRLRGVVTTQDEMDPRIIIDARADLPNPPTETDHLINEYPERALSLYLGGSSTAPVTHAFFNHWGSKERARSPTLLCLSLGSANRLSLIDPQESDSLRNPPKSPISAVFRNTMTRKQLRDMTYEAFGRYLVVDPIEMKLLQFRLSEKPPTGDEDVELGERGRAFHLQAQPITKASDGVKAYSGLWLALLSCPWRVALIDEPELFLHPPLARRLGLRLSASAAERGGAMVVSTHSADFLMGCVESGVNVDIVRLTYKEATPSAWHLSAGDLLPLMRDPLLRSANILRAVFHEGVVVGESDADRAFYQEINTRLLANAEKREGAEDTLFLNAQNKQTVHRIVAPLRRIGIPAAMIVDIDVLKMTTKEWALILQAAQVPPSTHQGLSTQKALVLKAFEVLKEGGGLDMKKCGLRALGRLDQRACEDLFSQLATYGIFVVPGGELESWLPQLNVEGSGSKHGVNWLIEVFEKMGADPSSPEYLKANQGDVWEFVRSIARWIRDPKRRGVAAE